jgi:hypothetical protein
VFLLPRNILNIMLTHETIKWARKLKQPLSFLKLKFPWAYDKIDLEFLFQCMSKLGFSEVFVNRSKILSRGASASVLVNEKPTQDFGIERGVWQEWHLVPYLILLVGEALNATI